MRATPRQLQTIYLFTLLTLFGNSLFAEEQLNLRGTSIIGSNELPQVLYIVPWKRMGMSRLKVSAEMSLIKETRELIDRDIFHREINFYHAMKSAE